MLSDLLGLTTVPAVGWLIALGLALVPVVATQAVRIATADDGGGVAAATS